VIYEVRFNKGGYSDYVIKSDGTIVTNKGSGAVLVTHINVLSDNDGRSASSRQCFSLFALIMQLQKELTKPVVAGDITWDEIVAGAK
jgi:hypothetical protein